MSTQDQLHAPQQAEHRRESNMEANHKNSQHGLNVLGLDLSSVAIAEARRKAQARGVKARFVVGNALDLLSQEEAFDTVIDSGLLHILSDADRARLVIGYHAVLRPGGYLHLLAFNEHATWSPSVDSGRDPYHL